MEENNKKKNKLIKRTLLFSITIFLIIAIIIPSAKKITSSLNKELTKIITPEKLEFNIDHVYSTTIKANLTAFLTQISEPEKLVKFDPKKFYADLKKKFKIIKKIEWNFSQPKIAKLKIECSSPLCKINNKWILGNKKRVFELNSFSDIDQNQLKNIELSFDFVDKKIDPNIFELLNNIPTQIWEKYNLSFIKPYNIEMQFMQTNFKKRPLFIVDTNTLLNIKKLEISNKIVERLSEDLEKKLGKQKTACFDLRFKNRVIYYKRSDIKNIGGGVTNG